MFHPKHVELFAGNKILYKKCHLVGAFLTLTHDTRIHEHNIYLLIIMLIFPFTSASCLLGLGADVSAVTGSPDQGLYHLLQTAYFHTFSDLFSILSFYVILPELLRL
jgi:hypothetical protein